MRCTTSRTDKYRWKTSITLSCLLLSLSLFGQKIRLTADKKEVPAHDFIQFTIDWDKPAKNLNPFVDVSVSGTFQSSDGQVKNIQGFCDSEDGRTYRLRFMPEQAADFRYDIRFSAPGIARSFSGNFRALPSSLKSVVEVSKDYPAHFQFRNSSQFFFWNGTTAYWLAGWKDMTVIDQSLERFAAMGINRVRVAINGRSEGGVRWSEPNVKESDQFTLKLNPWVARFPESLDNPAFDVSRMHIPHWKVLDHIMLKARQLDIVVSLIFYVDGLDHGCDPFKLQQMGNAFEKMYYQYAINRFAAFPNLMWDIANEYHLFRTPEWAEAMGSFVRQQDPYKHLISVHGSGNFPFRKSPWADVVMFQSWDECGGFDFVSQAMKDQIALGATKPVVNEEYGYEGHYPPWGCGATAAKERPDGRSAINRAMLAWEIYMAGGYQTTGETAEFGTGAGEDSGGGWINGRGNDKMIMLRYYQQIRKIFEKTAYWQMTPSSHLTNYGNYCLAREGVEYLLYARNPHCRVKLPDNTRFTVTKINPLTGEETSLGVIDSHTDNAAWQYRLQLLEPTVFHLKKIEP
jgi:aryl-phospho-beta-D-glucosidase BglC (GH1 family)